MCELFLQHKRYQARPNNIMALAVGKALGLGGYGNQGMMTFASILEGGKSADAKLALLQDDFGLTFKDKQAAAIVEAFTDPTTALTAYKTARTPIDTAAVVTFEKAVAQAKAAGLSTDLAVQYGRQRAVDYHAAEMELLHLTHPYAKSAEDLVALASGAKRKDILKKAAPPARPAAAAVPPGVD